MSLRSTAERHYNAQALLARSAVNRVTALWDMLGPGGFREAAGAAAEVTAAAQLAAAQEAAAYVPAAVAAQGVAPETGLVAVARSFVSPVDMMEVAYKAQTGTMFRQIEAGRDPMEAQAAARSKVAMIAGNEVQSAGTITSQVAITTQTVVTTYVRMLTRPSCARCVILAGREYRWSDGFARHPNCDCVHVPKAQTEGVDDVRTDPRGYFDSLTEAQQDATFGRANAQAIRDGADMNQVVNVSTKRGRAQQGLYEFESNGKLTQATWEGTTVREGRAGRRMALESGQLDGRTPFPFERANAPRLTPKAIYEQAGSREEALELLRKYGYIDSQPIDRSMRGLMRDLGRPNEALGVRGGGSIQFVPPTRLERIAALRDGMRVEFGDDPEDWFDFAKDEVGNFIPGPKANRAMDRVEEIGRLVDEEVSERLEARLAAMDVDVSAIGEARAALDLAEKRFDTEMGEFLTSVDRHFAKRHGLPPGTTFGDAVLAPDHLGLPDDDLGSWSKARGRWPNDPEIKAVMSDRASARQALHEAERLSLEQGSVIWQTQMREASIEVLSEVRGETFGGGAPKWVRGGAYHDDMTKRHLAETLPKNSEVAAAMDFAAGTYPRSWNAAVSDFTGGHIAVGIDEHRGYNWSGLRIHLNTEKHRLLGANDRASIAIHELGHSVEHSVRGLKPAEWAFLARRAIQDGVLPDMTTIYAGLDEVGWRDDFAQHYTGRVYTWTAFANFEVFTMAMQGVFGGHYHRNFMHDDGRVDDNLRHWLLGVMSVLGG